MAKITTRYRNSNGKTLYVQKRSFNPLVYLGYILWLFFMPKRPGQRYPDWGWYDWTDLSNKVYALKRDLNWHAEESERILKEMRAAEDFVKSEMKTLDKDSTETAGFSAPFKVAVHDLGPVGLDIKDPGDTWKKVFNSKLAGTGRKTASGKDFAPDNAIKLGGTKHTFYPEELAQFDVAFQAMAEERGSTGASPYKFSKGDTKSKGSSGSFNPHNRKKQAGESPEGHQARLKAIQSGDDVSEWVAW